MSIKRSVLCFALLVFVCPIYAQTFGEIVGEVRDSSGAVIPRATVTVTNLGTNASRTTQTNQEGIYTFPSLVPGAYRVRAEAQGFRSAVRSSLELQVQQIARVDFAMEVGQVAETIEVSAQAAVLNTEDATIGTVIENRRIVELPLNGRNFLQLVALSPNVTYGFATPGQAGGRQGGTRASQNISLSGMRGTWNHYTLDGIENTDVNFNLYVVLPSIDALQEFKVQSGVYPAEFGRAASQINVSTKSGTNDFHGSLFEFHRNDKLDAKQYDFTGKPADKTPFRWNQYGFTLGGPVWIPKVYDGRNRLFFMSNFEGYRDRKQFQSIYTTPTLAMRGGDFGYALPGNQLYDPASKTKANGGLTGDPFPGNIIPKSRFHQAGVKLLEFWPEPNISTSSLKDNYQKARPRTIDKDQFTTRMDFVESSNSQWFGRYSWTDEKEFNEQLKFNGSTLYTRAAQYMISNTRVLSPTMVNEARFGINDFYNIIGMELAGKRDVISELGIPGLSTPDPLTWGIPRITSLVNVSGFGNDSSGPFVVANAVFQLVDNFSWTRGKHSLRFGGEIRRDRYNQFGNEFARGSFEFNGSATSNPFTKKGGDSTADLLLGYTSKAESSIALAFSQFRATAWSTYVDDVWRISPKLTLNFGLRWEVVMPWWDRSTNYVNTITPMLPDVANVQDMSIHPVMLRAGTGEFYEGKDFRYPNVPVARDGRFGDRLMNADYNDLAPRFGIAYSPNQKWTFRSGFGMFYSAESNNSRFDLNRNMGGRVSLYGNAEVPDLTFDNWMTAASFPWVLPPGPFTWGVKPNLVNTYSMQYLFNIQREMGQNSVLEVGYIGSLSRHLQGLQNMNAPLPGTTSITARRPFPEFGTIQTVQSEGMGSYNSLATKFTRRMSAGLTYLVSYTWSKALDTSSAIRGTNQDIFPQDSRCLSCEKGHSAFDTPHRFVTSVMYELPFGRGKKWLNQGGFVNQVLGGWQLGTIWTTQSGRPINLQPSWDTAGTGGYGEIRLIATGQDPYLPGNQRNTEQWFNKDAFRSPVGGEFGNVARNLLIGPTNTTWDFSTLKNFSLFENHQFQFRFEAFNFPNHPRWGSPNQNWGSRDPVAPGPSFGTIRGAGTMRELQFGLKYVF